MIWYRRYWMPEVFAVHTVSFSLSLIYSRLAANIKIVHKIGVSLKRKGNILLIDLCLNLFGLCHFKEKRCAFVPFLTRASEWTGVMSSSVRKKVFDVCWKFPVFHEKKERKKEKNFLFFLYHLGISQMCRGILRGSDPQVHFDVEIIHFSSFFFFSPPYTVIKWL